MKCDAGGFCEGLGDEGNTCQLNRPRDLLTVFKYIIAVGKEETAVTIYQRACSSEIPEENRWSNPFEPNIHDEDESLAEFFEKIVALNPDVSEMTKVSF